MATRSTIGMRTEDGIRAVYCHWDGYPEGVGETLKVAYATKASVVDLLDLGDISSLDDTLERSVFYVDRGEELKIHTFKSSEQWIEWANNCGCEYAYLFDGDTWKTEQI